MKNHLKLNIYEIKLAGAYPSQISGKELVVT
jgi:hypothetical protein